MLSKTSVFLIYSIIYKCGQIILFRFAGLNKKKKKLRMEAIKKILMHENDLELEQHPVKLCYFAIFQSSHFHNTHQ